MKVCLKIEADRVDCSAGTDRIEASCYGVSVEDLVESLLSGPYQQEVVRQVQEAVRQWEGL